MVGSSDSRLFFPLQEAPPKIFSVGPLGCLTAVVDGNISGRALHKVVARRRRRAGAGGLVGVAEGVAEEVDSVALEAGSEVGVDGGGGADVGVAEEFLDHDEFRSLLQEVAVAWGRSWKRMRRGPEVPGEGGPFDWDTVGSGEDVAAVLPARARSLAFPGLSVAVLFEGAQARRGSVDVAERGSGPY